MRSKLLQRIIRFFHCAAGLAVAGCVGAWLLAYSPDTCYEALNGRRIEFPPFVCDLRFGMTFVFRLDSIQNVLAVLGWSFMYALLGVAATSYLLRSYGTLAATLFASTASAALWLLLVWSLNRSPYQCAFGFGGFSCGGLLSILGLSVSFSGWLLPIAALIGIPLVAKLRARDARVSIGSATPF